MIARVLIADQRPHVSRIVAHQCCRAGFDVILVDDCDDAKDVLAEEHVDLAIFSNQIAAQCTTLHHSQTSDTPCIIVQSETPADQAAASAHTEMIHAVASFELPCRVRTIVRAARNIIIEERRDDADHASHDTRPPHDTRPSDNKHTLPLQKRKAA